MENDEFSAMITKNRRTSVVNRFQTIHVIILLNTIFYLCNNKKNVCHFEKPDRNTIQYLFIEIILH